MLVASSALPEQVESAPAVWVQKGMLAVLVLFPYFLYRFMHSFVRPIPWLKTTAEVVTGGLVLASLFVPRIPDEGDPRPIWLEVYIATLLIQWVFLSGFVSVRLWRAGRDQPSVARRRMRVMSLGASGLALALVVAGEFSSGGASEAVVQLLALAAAPLMLIGFAPPYMVRAWWQREEEAALKQAERSLMEATSSAAVAAALLPHARGLLGGKAALLFDSDGKIVASDGDEDGADRSSEVPGNAASDPDREASSVSIALGTHTLVIHASPFTPFFGREEIERLEGFAALAHLALARNVLLDEQGRLATIVRTSNDAILSKSLDGVITSWNEGAERIYGYSAAEVIGKPVSILVPPELENDLPKILARARAGEAIQHYETKRLTKSGQLIDVSLSVSPLRNTSGEVVGVSTIARDVTSQRKVEAALRDNEAFLQTIYSASPDIITMIKPDGQLGMSSPAALDILGYSADEYARMDRMELIHPEDRESVDSTLRSLIDGGGSAQVRCRVRHADGHWVPLEVRTKGIIDDEGHLAGFASVSRDVGAQVALETSLHEARLQAETANKAKSDFMSRMSHELRTPLNAILGFGQLLELEDLPADQRDSVQQIIKGGRRLLDLINEVLDIARIESGTMQLSLEPVHVDRVVRDAVELIRPLAAGRGIRLRAEVPPETGSAHVVADQQRLGQVLLNLLSNAVKYNADQGVISVTGVNDGDRIRIGVTDTGAGIPEDQIPRLFTPFDRLGAEQTDVEGTGLGLTLSKRLLEAMGGDLLVDTMQGEGTTFWIELAASEGPDSEPRVATSSEVDRARAGGKVLYIEDNLSNLRLIERLVGRRTALELIPAMTGTLGIELAQQHRPGLILLDLHLPDMQGDDVLILLRKDPRTRGIPVVILSADATPGQIERLRAAGADDYLTKPIDVVAFLEVLDRILGPNGGHE